MVKRFVAFLVFFNCAVSFAQTIKTDVLVIGSNPSGVSAAIQCAKSKVKTILIEQSDALCPKLKGAKPDVLTFERILPSGFWGEFCDRAKVYAYKGQNERYKDTSENRALKIPTDTVIAMLNRIADTTKNLSITTGISVESIKRDGDYWEVSLVKNGDKSTIKARVVVDDSEHADLLKRVGATIPVEAFIDLDKANTGYYTSIASTDHTLERLVGPDDGFLISTLHEIYPMRDIVAKGADNLLVAEEPLRSDTQPWNLPAQLNLGQGVGVTAAYCAFYKTTTSHLNVRIIQGELQDFKGYLLPLADIVHDRYWRSIQQICATGLLKGVEKRIDGLQSQIYFVPDSIVTTAEIKPGMLEIYTRAFIWFNKEKPGAQFTLGNLMSFISDLTLTDPDNLQKSISKAWTDQFHFTSAFDLDKPLTRREFAILANKYLNPFGRTVDLDGRVVN